MIEHIISLLVGLSIFIVGMNMMSTGLKKSAGTGVKKLFSKTQNNRFISIGIGIIVTALVQSSSATSAMVIGFINAEIMSVFQGIGVMLGAFVGTSVTGLIVSLSSFNISIYLTLFAFIGLLLTFSNKEKVKHIGEFFTGFGILFFGLQLVSSSFKDDPDLSNFLISIFNSISFPLLLILVGTLFTALLQSSSASTSIFIVMVGMEVLDFKSAMYLCIGATIGAMLPIILSTIGGSINSKRAVFVGMSNRLISAIILTAIIWPLQEVLSNAFELLPTTELAVAIFNIVYNLISVLITIPFMRQLEKLSYVVIKDKQELNKKNSIKYIDDRFIKSPDVAIMQIKKEIENMANLALINFKLGYSMIISHSLTYEKELNDREDEIDYINNAITEYLIKVSPKLDQEQEKEVGSFFHVVNDIERIGDHASNFLDTASKMIEKDVEFSKDAIKELDEMYQAIVKMFDIAINAFDKMSLENLEELHKLEEKTDELKNVLSSKHYERILKNECKVELSPFYTTFVSELERIADHLTNIGYSIINPTGDDNLIK